MLTKMSIWLESVRGFLDSHSFGIAVVAAVFVVAAGAGFTAWQWDWLHGSDTEATASTTLRNMGLLVAGGLAIVFAAWRGWVAERQSATAQRQAETSQEQADTAYRGLLNERYQRGAEMLGSEVLAVRMAGIYALHRLAEDDPEQYHIQVMQLLCAFVVQTSNSNSTVGEMERRNLADHAVIFAGPDSALPLSMDVQAAIEAIRLRSEVGISIERLKWYRLGLASAKLRGAILPDADLRMAVLTGADLTGAKLSLAKLNGAWLDGANLTNADLFHSDISGAVLIRPRPPDGLMEGPDLAKLDRRAVKGLTQEQLDDTLAIKSRVPELDGILDAATGKPLYWRGLAPGEEETHSYTLEEVMDQSFQPNYDVSPGRADVNDPTTEQ